MPKLKTNKSVQRRFKVSGKRKVTAHKGKRRHLLTDRTPSQKRKLRKKWSLNKVDTKAVLRALPYS